MSPHAAAAYYNIEIKESDIILPQHTNTLIIEGAGGAAHLPRVVAALSPTPVIGVPCRSTISLDGWD